MSMSATYNIINSAFLSNAAQSAVISSNVSNANTTGYSREVANIITTADGGSELGSVTREANEALLEQVNASTSQAASQQALATGLATLAATVSDSSSSSSTSGSTENGNSPSAMLANLQDALTTYESSPSSASAGQAVVTAADNLVSSLNSGSATVQQVREQADADMASSVSTINSLLNQYSQVNATIVSGLASGANVNSAEDTRDTILTELSKQIGISTVANPNGSTSIYTDSGVTLFDNTAHTLSFTPTQTYTAGSTGDAATTGNDVTVDGVPITGASSPMPIQSGALAGLAKLRDNVAPEYQSQLDQIADGLINAFGESDQTGKGGASLPGLFTYAGATSLPTATGATGLAASIEVNSAVDPTQGGDISLLQNGGINGSAYVYNTTGAAGYTGRIQQMVAATTSTQSFDPNVGLGSSDTLSDYANASVSWLNAQNQQATNQADYQNTLVTQATAALSNATGVSLDTEMTNMLSIENTYTTTAKLLTTVNDMFTALLDAA
ncbi:MAG: flagellar hook-associated protein FlgK [Roseiarcus sp.]|jgi:flagellar hook-associated protein 1 FlgK